MFPEFVFLEIVFPEFFSGFIISWFWNPEVFISGVCISEVCTSGFCISKACISGLYFEELYFRIIFLAYVFPEFLFPEFVFPKFVFPEFVFPEFSFQQYISFMKMSRRAITKLKFFFNSWIKWHMQNETFPCKVIFHLNQLELFFLTCFWNYKV